jgi:hypothetical protein
MLHRACIKNDATAKKQKKKRVKVHRQRAQKEGKGLKEMRGRNNATQKERIYNVVRSYTFNNATGG